jgi:hypothetical protein
MRPLPRLVLAVLAVSGSVLGGFGCAGESPPPRSARAHGLAAVPIDDGAAAVAAPPAAPAPAKTVPECGDRSVGPCIIRHREAKSGSPEIDVTVGQTVTLVVAGVDRFSNAAQSIADVRVDPSNGTAFLITGKAAGTTSLVLVQKDGSQRAYEVVTSLRPADVVSKELAMLLAELPSVRIMRSGPRFVLHGAVHREDDLKRVQNVAGLYGEQVANIVVLEK